jgi:tetratricopeptide (TPR) repeat protein
LPFIDWQAGRLPYNKKSPTNGGTVTGGAFLRRQSANLLKRENYRLWVYLTAGLLLALRFSGDGYADPSDQHAGHHLGKVNFPVSCSKEAQVEFNRAVALLHHMTYPEAQKGFERVAAIDPKCAMAHWGIAMTLFQPLWPTRPSPKALQQGWEEVQKAKALAPPTERERLFVAAVEAFFLDPTSTDYWLRIHRWEQAMEKVYKAFPNDPEAGAFYALAYLATAPSDRISREHSDRAAAILLRIYKQNPDHPGAMHYLVHANDVPGRERESLEIIRKYETVAPDNPHALHMPTHIYTRLGDWDGSIRGNLRAADAALKYPVGEHGEFVWDEFPHAIEYLIYAYLQKGADDQAATQLKRLRGTEHLEPTFKTAFHLASTQARYALERRAWDEAMAIVPRQPADLDWDHFTWAEAIARFARGLGAAHLGKIDAAKSEAARLEELENATRKAKEELFTRNIGVLRLELTAWIDHMESNSESSLATMRKAVDVETSTPKAAVTPGPTLPAFELLGDLLMEQKQPAQALVAYKQSLELYPRRFNSLLGAARAAHGTNDKVAARTFYKQLLDVANGGTRQQLVTEAKNYLHQRAD